MVARPEDAGEVTEPADEIAALLAAGPIEPLLLRRIREVSPCTAIVVVTKTPTDPDLKRAFESGATAYLLWPASTDGVRHAIERGTLLASPGIPAMKTEDPPAPARPASDGGITIHNRLPPGHRCQVAMDETFRVALRGLPGPWDVSVCPVGLAWFRIDVVAPDGASWSTWFPVHEGPRAEDLADTVRAACARHFRLEPTNGKRRAGKPADCSAGDRDGGPKAGSQRGGVASVPSLAAPEGKPK